ncbi:MAG TPA: SUMF1/EgtB/PvdO family nonheme iron enzyme, partial [Polyangiaceae bacterium]
ALPPALGAGHRVKPAAERDAAGQRAATPAPTLAACPGNMAEIAGGPFSVGSDLATNSTEQRPRFLTRVAAFCLDLTEVTVSEYQKCVAAAVCEPAHDDRPHCNAQAGRPLETRRLHPVNCVSFHQAEAYCRWRGARLPSEVEWEYAARGGDRDLKYPWGDENPDGHACWKHQGTCPVKSFEAGAFGLYDISGNVWEWTEDWFGAYPWPPVLAWSKVYRGGGWSRRFDKWMDPRLRNRENPNKWGSHLGFRCAGTPPSVECPYGRTHDGARCQYAVEGRQCPRGQLWNSLRCAPPGAPRCAVGRVEVAGHGCVLEATPTQPPEPVDPNGVTSTRDANLDADCRASHPERPHAFRYAGGTHRGRNLVSSQAGCTNRDVGVGWNSACCP